MNPQWIVKVENFQNTRVLKFKRFLALENVMLWVTLVSFSLKIFRKSAIAQGIFGSKKFIESITEEKILHVHLRSTNCIKFWILIGIVAIILATEYGNKERSAKNARQQK